MKIKNWTEFQHYAHRNPPWIKLHKKLLDDPDWFELDGELAKFLVMLWLIASDEKDGKLPASKKIAFRTRLTEKQVDSYLQRLSEFVVQDASKVLDRVETEKRRGREETETKKRKGELDARNIITF